MRTDKVVKIKAIKSIVAIVSERVNCKRNIGLQIYKNWARLYGTSTEAALSIVVPYFENGCPSAKI